MVTIQTVFIESPPYILKGSREAHRFRVLSNLELIWNKLHQKCSWHFYEWMGRLSGTKPHFHPRLHKPVLKVLPMNRYIVAIIYFFGGNFSLTVSCFKYGSQIASYTKNWNIFYKCNMMADIYLNQKQPFAHVL